MAEWDYLFLSVPIDPQNDWISIQEKCKSMGKEGWELVTITDDTNPGLKELKVKLWVFKRLIK